MSLQRKRQPVLYILHGEWSNEAAIVCRYYLGV